MESETSLSFLPMSFVGPNLTRINPVDNFPYSSRLNSRSRFLFEKLIIADRVKNFLAFFGTVLISAN
jgi:hypothetical protein